LPDMTLCRDDRCPSREYCYRWKTKSTDTFQSYFMGTPRIGGEFFCKHFIAAEPDKK
jgi:hypothetical protein